MFLDGDVKALPKILESYMDEAAWLVATLVSSL
jgi:hypothetical protein